MQRTVFATASTLNVRKEPSTDSPVLMQVAKGTELPVIAEQGGWMQVRLEDGRTGWVALRFVSSEKVEAERPRQRTVTKRTTQSASGKRGCEADYSFIETPKLTFSQEDAHGLVVVEASVNAKGVVTSTKVVRNDTGSSRAGEMAEREIRSAKFAPPIRNCQPRSFIFTYRRTF